MLRRLIYQLIAFILVLALALAGFFYWMLRPITCAPICVGVNLAGRDLRGLDLQGVNFVEANLTSANLRGANLRDADFSGAKLIGVNLRNADLTDAKLIGADLTRVHLNEGILRGTDLSGANLSEADLTGVDLTETVVNGANFLKAKLTDTKLENANLSGVKFNQSNLSGADLSGANLSGATFSRADASGTHFANSLMVGVWLNLANLTGADLSGANLLGSQIIGGRLTSANLTNGNLQGSVAIGANFDGANLRGANLQQMQVVTAQLNAKIFKLDPVLSELNELQRKEILVTINLNGVQSDQQTQWPSYLSPLGVIESALPQPATLSETLTTPSSPSITSLEPLSATRSITNPSGIPETETILEPIATDPSASNRQQAETDLPSETISTTHATLQDLLGTDDETIENPQAKRLKINFFLQSLDNVNDLAGTFDADFYVDLFWQDQQSPFPSLAAQAKATAAQQPALPNQADTTSLLDPVLEVVNVKRASARHRFYGPSIEPGSNVRLRTWVQGNFSSPLDLRKFPFDQQRLSLKLESAEFDSEALLLDFVGFSQPATHSEEPFSQTIPMGRYVAKGSITPGWLLTELNAVQRVRVLSYDNSSWSQLQLELVLNRIDAPYQRRMLLGLAFLLMLAWGILWVDGNQLHFRLGLLFVFFIVINLFNIILWHTLPKLPYLTFLDHYLFACYLTIVALVAYSLVYYWFTNRNYPTITTWLNRVLLIAYPVYVVVLNVLLFGSLRG